MKIAIVGGTHGNERTGVYLVKKWMAEHSPIFTGFETKLFLGNPKAIEAEKRFVDFDLNRSFNDGCSVETAYEFQRSVDLKKEIMDWAGNEELFLIDLHTTTSNMGTTFVLSRTDYFTAKVLKKIQKKLPESKILFNEKYDDESVFVDSLSPHGLIIEVGPVAQNLLHAETIRNTEIATHAVFSAIREVLDQNHVKPVELDVYQEVGTVYYPNNDALSALIHPALQGKDFELLKPGDPIFLLPDQTVVNYEGNGPVFPVFINEAAYYKDGIAFLASRLTTKSFS